MPVSIMLPPSDEPHELKGVRTDVQKRARRASAMTSLTVRPCHCSASDFLSVQMADISDKSQRLVQHNGASA
jgi:hypothetical protein